MTIHTKWYWWCILLPVTCLFWGINSYHRPEIVEKFERLVYDHHLGHLDEPRVTPEIVMVMVGEDSISELGRWPWPRSVHAKLLDHLTQAHTVVLDVLFPDPGPHDHDQALVAAANRTKNLVLAMHMASPAGDSTPQILRPFPMLNRVTKAMGYTNMETDKDGLVRFCRPYREYNGRLIPSLPLAAAFAIMGRTSQLETTGEGDINNGMNSLNLPVDTDGRLWINHGKSNATVYEYYQVLNGEVPQNIFKDKIVVVGVSASGIEDYFKIPSRFGSLEITGAQLNNNIIKSILTQKVPNRVSPLMDGLLTAVIVLAGAALTIIHRPIWNLVAMILVAGTLYFLHQHLFVTQYIYTAFLLPLSGMVLAFSFFLFLKLKFIHHDTEIKTFSISSIIGLPRDLGQEAKNFDDYLRSIWEKIEKTTGIYMISPQITWEEMTIPVHLKAQKGTSIRHDKVIMVEDDKGEYAYLAMIPVLTHHSAKEQAYTLLGWKKRLSEPHIQAAVAVVLSTAWYFERLQQADEQKQLLLNTIHAISATIDAKDPITGGHSNRVSTLAKKIAEQLSLDKKEQENIYLGALIHDIGKIGVPDSILSKDGKLTQAEFDEIRRHPSVGKKLMASVKLPETSWRGMYEHHERFDGSGYPLGLKGDQINMAGRIIAVADVFDALISDRPYRKAVPLQEALAYMQARARIDFDINVVCALCDVVERNDLPVAVSASLVAA